MVKNKNQSNLDNTDDSINNATEDLQVSIIMGSQSDYNIMQEAEKVLNELSIKYETKIVSAHRTPDRLYNFAKNIHLRGVKVIIAGAGGAAHLAGMTASMTHLPVIGVPVASKNLNGIDSLMSTAQMPNGVPVATVAINGSKNAGILAASILSTFDKNIEKNLINFRQDQTNSIDEDIINKKVSSV
jgi:5-(carboxyamino)imidazole ribonucleotide mutase